MSLWIFPITLAILFLIYKSRINKVPDGLKNVYTLTIYDRFISIIKKRGPDQYYHFIKKYLERDGFIKIWYGGRWFCLVVDNAIAKDLLSNPDTFPKLMLDEHFPNSLIARYYGVNVVHSNGTDWQRYRKICNPAFKSLPMHFFIETGDKLMDMLEKIDNKPIEVRDLMHRFTLDVLGKAAFGMDFNNLGDPNNIYVTAYNKVQEDIQNPYFIYFPILNYIPFLNKQRFKRVEELDNKFDKIIEQKREDLVNGNTESNRKDLLDLMLKACEDPENQNLTNTELRHNLGVFMLAGHDTTASSLATVLYLLAAHKDVQQQAREEILTVLGDDLTPSAEQHRSLKYLNMIIYENLRLYPPIAILPARVTTKDIECCGNVIPTGACIQIFIYGIHHSSKLWKNPEEFLPERFEDQLHKYEESGSWFGFGGGSRKCLGYNFSMIEQRIVLCLLLRKYEISLTPNGIHKDGLKIDVAYSGTMSPLPVELVFKRRSE